MRQDYQEVTKSSTVRGGTISKKEQVEAHEAAFGGLLEQVAKETGLPGDEVLYADPMGFHTGGQPVDLRKKMYTGPDGSNGWKDAFTAFNKEVRAGAEIREAAKNVVSKAYDRSNASLPIFVSPDVTITDRKQTPLADMVARVAIDEDTYKVDELTDHGAVERYYEPGTNSGTDETWVENDDSYTTHSYDVVPYGRQTAVTDFLQLAASTLRSSRSLTEEALVRSVRHYEESQAIQGQGNASNVAGNDPNGFEGLFDLAASGNLTNEGGSGTLNESKVREDIRVLRRNGADYDDLVGVTDHKTFEDLKDSVDDFVRYQSPGDELDFGFRALNVDGVPIMESHGCPDSSGARLFVMADMSTVGMAMLQDTTLHPLARTTPQEDVAVDAYGTLFASAPSERIVGRTQLA
jgi:hypothetical protein